MWTFSNIKVTFHTSEKRQDGLLLEMVLEFTKFIVVLYEVGYSFCNIRLFKRMRELDQDHHQKTLKN